MGLDEIIDITEVVSPSRRDGLERKFRVMFTTEKTSSTFTFDMSEEEFLEGEAVRLARERAEQIDAPIGSGAEAE